MAKKKLWEKIMDKEEPMTAEESMQAIRSVMSDTSMTKEEREEMKYVIDMMYQIGQLEQAGYDLSVIPDDDEPHSYLLNPFTKKLEEITLFPSVTLT